ncbi:MAG: arsenate reductase ArsC [Pyrinomonadaceae bacterium]
MKKRILILCTGNSARSQMAEGLLGSIAGSEFEVESAGTKPGSVRSEAITVMREIGIDISAQWSKSVDKFAGQEFDVVITVCDNVRGKCPYFPAKTKLIHQSFEDPAIVIGNEETRLLAFRRVRDEIESFLNDFCNQQNSQEYKLSINKS